MSAIATATARRGLLFSGRDLWSFLADVLGLWSASAEPDELELSPHAVAFAQTAFDLTEPAWRSLNVQTLKQTLGEIGLSVQFASVALSLITDENVRAMKSVGEVSGPLRPHPQVVARLGKPTADLVTEALVIGVGVTAIMAPRALQAIRVEAPTPEALAEARHTAVLGDVLPARVTRKMLASLQGEAALFMLLAASAGIEKLRDWIGVPVGEMAVEGMQAAADLLAIDLQAAATEHAEFKKTLFERLNSTQPDDDWDDDEDPNAS